MYFMLYPYNQLRYPYLAEIIVRNVLRLCVFQEVTDALEAAKAPGF